jgi:hypothetical protein
MRPTSKHTKGPWLNQSPHIVPAPAIGYAICEMNALPDFHEEEQRANAHLIAAAPEMLELLRSCHDYMCDASSFATEWVVADKVRNFFKQFDRGD